MKLGGYALIKFYVTSLPPLALSCLCILLMSFFITSFYVDTYFFLHFSRLYPLLYVVSVGYEYESCASLILWEKRTAILQGYELDPTNLGGWSLNKHHILNTRSGTYTHALMFSHKWAHTFPLFPSGLYLSSPPCVACLQYCISHKTCYCLGEGVGYTALPVVHVELPGAAFYLFHRKSSPSLTPSSTNASPTE